MKKIIVFVLSCVVMGFLGWRIYIKLSETQPVGGRGGSRAMAVAVEPVQQTTIRDVVQFTGTLLPKSRFIIAPKVSGRLEKLMVNIGDEIRSGDLIAVLDSDEYVEQVAQAQAELEVSRANRADYSSGREIAERELNRIKELWEQKVASTADYEQAQARLNAAAAKLQVAEAQIKQRQAALKAAELRLSFTRIHAEWERANGTRLIAERFVYEGTLLRANDPIVSVVDNNTMVAVIYVIERDFPGIRIGQRAVIRTDAYEDRTFEGRIARFAPVLHEESRQARVEIELSNPDLELVPGMFVRARIQFAEHENATVVPNSALTRRNGNQGVFLVEMVEHDGERQYKASFVPLTLGIIAGNEAEVLEPDITGLVVTLGHHLLEDGAAVVLPEKE